MSIRAEASMLLILGEYTAYARARSFHFPEMTILLQLHRSVFLARV
jgi:hypothetical protein